MLIEPTKHYILWMSVVYIGTIALYVVLSGTPFVYPLDDTYIHLALGRTLASYGVWGVEPTAPASASSSPLWSLLLAGAYRIWPAAWSGAFEFVPLLLNIVFGVLTLVLWDWIICSAKPSWSAPWRWFSLFILWFIVPLTPLSLLGMEHVLQLFLTTLLIWLCVSACSLDGRPVPVMLLTIVTVFAVAARYETLFAVAPLGLIALLRRRLDIAAVLALGAALPVVGFGLYWQAHGGFLLPNTLMLKGAAPVDATGAVDFLLHLLNDLKLNLLDPTLSIVIFGAGAILVGLLWIDLWRKGSVWRIAPLIAIVVITAIAIQYVVASVGWLYRYEAWLIGLEGVAIILFLPASLPTRGAPIDAGGVITSTRWSAACLLLLTLTATPRVIKDSLTTFRAIDDRRNEHLLPAEFIHDYYNNKVVLVNDLGMAAYYSDARLLDFYGLGHNDPARMRRLPGGYGPSRLADWASAEHGSIAIVQICWDEVNWRIPETWRLIEIWRVPRNVVFGDRDVGFFAISSDDAPALEAALEKFRVPPQIKVVNPDQNAFKDFIAARRNHRPSPNDLCPS